MPKTVSLTEEILKEFKNQVKEYTIIPSSGGVFEVTVNNEIIFSKKQLDRFPNEGEVIDKLKGMMG